jgi:hypothetical protein
MATETEAVSKLEASKNVEASDQEIDYERNPETDVSNTTPSNSAFNTASVEHCTNNMDIELGSHRMSAAEDPVVPVDSGCMRITKILSLIFDT